MRVWWNQSNLFAQSSNSKSMDDYDPWSGANKGRRDPKILFGALQCKEGTAQRIGVECGIKWRLSCRSERAMRISIPHVCRALCREFIPCRLYEDEERRRSTRPHFDGKVASRKVAAVSASRFYQSFMPFIFFLCWGYSYSYRCWVFYSFCGVFLFS